MSSVDRYAEAQKSAAAHLAEGRLAVAEMDAKILEAKQERADVDTIHRFECRRAQAGFELRRAEERVAEAIHRAALAIEHKAAVAKLDAATPAVAKASADFTARVLQQIDALAADAQAMAAKAAPLDEAMVAIPWDVRRDLNLGRPLSPWEGLAHGRVAFLERAVAVARAEAMAKAPPSVATTPNAGKPWPPGWNLKVHTLNRLSPTRGSWE